MSYWVYKVNSKESHAEYNKRAFGDWQSVFDSGEEMEWGGTWATGDANSLRFLREEMQEGDIIFAYQTDKSAIMGLCVVKDFMVYDDDEDARDLWLQAKERFRKPFPVLRVKKEDRRLANIRAFQHNSLGTLHALTDSDAQALLNACRKYQRG